MEEPREKIVLQQQQSLDETSSESVDPEAMVGMTLGGRYAITRPIGKGGMGVVYLARQSALDREVVVKVLGRGLTGEGEAMQRFEREALGLSKLTHPNIVTIYDFGRDHDQAYIVMEYVDGEMLGELMARVGYMSFELFAPVAAQILAALAEAHARGIIHRDIKPSNIMLCERHGTPNFVKVLDFGLVKLVGEAKEVTKKQSLVGSVTFLAPEQILGLEFDQRADVYALGVLFYYMLSGKKPFLGEDDIAILYQHIHKDAEPLKDMLPAGHDIPEELMALVHRCLSKSPEARPQDARAVLELMHGLDTRATFMLPWSSGEFAAVSRESSQVVRAPSGAHHVVELTPVSQRQIPTLGQDTSGSYEPISEAEFDRPSRSGSAIAIPSPALTARLPVSVVEPPVSSTNRVLLGSVALLLFLLIVGGGVILFLIQEPTETSAPDSVDALATPDPLHDTTKRDALLAEVDTLLAQQRWGQAEMLLAPLTQPSSSASTLRLAAEREELIAVGRLLQKAQLAEEDQAREQARDHYEAILARVPSHPVATQKLAALTAEDREQAAQMSTLEVTTTPRGATIFLDGLELGTSPMEVEFESGEYTLRLTAPGYREVEQPLTLGPGTHEHLTVTLLPASRKSPATKPSPSRSVDDRATDLKPPTDPKPVADDRDALLIPVEKPRAPKSNTDDLLPVGK